MGHSEIWGILAAEYGSFWNIGYSICISLIIRKALRADVRAHFIRDKQFRAWLKYNYQCHHQYQGPVSLAFARHSRMFGPLWFCKWRISYTGGGWASSIFYWISLGSSNFNLNSMRPREAWGSTAQPAAEGGSVYSNMIKKKKEEVLQDIPL